MGEHIQNLTEARDCVHAARAAFDAFMVMLSGDQPIKQEGLYFLLQPVAGNLEQAEQCLNLVAAAPAAPGSPFTAGQEAAIRREFMEAVRRNEIRDEMRVALRAARQESAHG